MIDPSATMREFATQETWELLASAAKQIRKAAADPHEDAVHKMRVSIRRFQQALRLFAQFFSPKGLRRVKADLKAVMDPAGELRNRDIALKLTGARSAAARQITAHREQHGAGLTVVLTDLASDDLADRWQADLGASRRKRSKQKKLWKGKQTVRDNLRRRMPRLVRDYFEAGDQALAAGRSWDEMHRFRLLTKRFRYTMELFRPAYGRSLESKIELLKQVQTMLGDINDAVVTSAMLESIPRTDRLRIRLGVKADRLTHQLRALWTARFADPARRDAWTRYLVQYACRTRPVPAQAAQEPVTEPQNVTEDAPKPPESVVY